MPVRYLMQVSRTTPDAAFSFWSIGVWQILRNKNLSRLQSE